MFGGTTDAAAVVAMRPATNREVIPVQAAAVARLGGSVRCLCARMKGENARRLIRAARGRVSPPAFPSAAQ
ncbi:MAG: agmatine deiminase family protein [Lentisphaerae bacterium]|nr:agmatine deiminase family protein [Lentisphaerota bacterium]